MTLRKRIINLRNDVNASEARILRRRANGWRWHYPLTLPFILAYDQLDIAVLKLRIAILEHQNDRQEKP